LLPAPDYLEEDSDWSESVHEFLYRNGIRWIFVSTDEPYGNERQRYHSYGDNCYYVLIPDNKVLTWIPDVHEISANICVYNVNEIQPKLIPIEQNELV